MGRKKITSAAITKTTTASITTEGAAFVFIARILSCGPEGLDHLFLANACLIEEIGRHYFKARSKW